MARPTVTFNDGSMRKVGDMLGQAMMMAMMYPGGGAAGASGAMEAGASKAITSGAAEAVSTGEAEQLAAQQIPAVTRGLPTPGSTGYFESDLHAPTPNNPLIGATEMQDMGAPGAAALPPSPFLSASAVGIPIPAGVDAGTAAVSDGGVVRPVQPGIASALRSLGTQAAPLPEMPGGFRPSSTRLQGLLARTAPGLVAAPRAGRGAHAARIADMTDALGSATASEAGIIGTLNSQYQNPRNPTYQGVGGSRRTRQGGLLNFLSFIRNKLPNFGPFNRQPRQQQGAPNGGF